VVRTRGEGGAGVPTDETEHEQRGERATQVDPTAEPTSGDEEHRIRGQNVAMADVEITGQ